MKLRKMIKEDPYKKKGAKTDGEQMKDNMEDEEGKTAMECGVHTGVLLSP